MSNSWFSVQNFKTGNFWICNIKQTSSRLYEISIALNINSCTECYILKLSDYDFPFIMWWIHCSTFHCSTCSCQMQCKIHSFYQSSLMSNEHIQCIVLYCFIFQVSVKQEEEFRRQKRRRPFIWRSNSSLEILADTMHVPQGMVIVFSLLSGLKLDRYRFLVCVTLKWELI